MAILDLNEELAMGEHAYEISSLFPRNEAAEQWAQPVMRRYQQLLEERLVADVNPSIYDTYVGQYEVPAALKDPSPPLTVIRDGDRLFEQLPSWWKHELLPQSETSFFHVVTEASRPHVDHEVTFVKDETGQVTHLITEFQGEEFIFKRIDTVPVRQHPTPAESSPSPQEGQGKNRLQWGWIVMPVLVLVALVAWYGIHKLRGK